MEFKHVNLVEVDNGLTTGQWIELDGFDALEEWRDEIYCHDVRQVARQAIGTNPSRWDHLSPRRGTAPFAATVMKMQFAEGEVSPVMALAEGMDDYFKRVAECVCDGHTVLINRRGGFSFLIDSMTVLSRKVYENEFSLAEIREDKDATVVNLENDPEPERYAVDYMKKRWGAHSIILSLREYSESQLVAALDRMAGKGVDTVFVYTTGNDVFQMESYMECIMDSDINNLVIHFVDTPTQEHLDILKKFEDQGLNVEHDVRSR